METMGDQAAVSRYRVLLVIRQDSCRGCPCLLLSHDTVSFFVRFLIDCLSSIHQCQSRVRRFRRQTCAQDAMDTCKGRSDEDCLCVSKRDLAGAVLWHHLMIETEYWPFVI